jgi:hypothetical protein
MEKSPIPRNMDWVLWFTTTKKFIKANGSMIKNMVLGHKSLLMDAPIKGNIKTVSLRGKGAIFGATVNFIKDNGKKEKDTGQGFGKEPMNRMTENGVRENQMAMEF